MADLPLKKGSELPIADSVGDNDVFFGIQGGVTKQIPAAVARRYASNGEFNAKWYGAKGDGVADDTAAINSALAAAAGGGCVYLPSGTYLISNSLNNSAEGVTLRGANGRTTKIVQSNLSARIINNTGMFFSFRDIHLDYSGTPTGGQAIWSSGGYSVFKDFTIRQAFTGVYLTSGAAQILKDFNVFNYTSVGVHLRNINDVFMRDFVLNAGDLVKGALGGIRKEDKVEAFVCSTGEVLQGVYSMTATAAVFGANTRAAYNFFDHVFFDSSAQGVPISNMVETNFDECWFSGGRVTGAASPGATISAVDSVRFTDCIFFNNGSHGAYLRATAKKVSFTNCDFESNSVTSGDGVANGLQVENGTTDWSVTGGKASNGLYTGKQGYGISIGTGCSDFNVSGVNLKGNLTGAANDSSTSPDKGLSANIGYRTKNKGTASVIVGQTVATVTHGLAKTPTAADIALTFASAPVSSGVASVYVTSINATTFQIVTNAAVATNALSVSWRADISGF